MSRRILGAVLAASVALSPCGWSSRAEEADVWKLGLAKVAITPTERTQLSGYAARVAPFENIEHDLYAKVAVFEDHQGHRGVLITADLIGFFAELSDAICSKIHERTGLPRECILLNASHTHAGPELNPERGVSPELAEATRRYVAALTNQVADAVAEAAGKMQPVRLAHGRGVANFVMNRREFTARGVVLGVQPSGLADRSVPVLVAKDAAGKIVCVVFGAACHNTTLTGDNLTVSGDYAGFAQAQLEAELPGAQAMFVLGCGGDANPYPRGTMALAKEHGSALARETLRLAESNLTPVRGPLRTLLVQVDLPLQPAPTRATAEKLAQSRISYEQAAGKAMLAQFDKGQKLPTHYRAPLALWQFGDDLTLVAISGETVVDYVPLVENALGPLRLWVAGYANDVFGYLPSARVLAEGGYETRGLIRGGVGLFSPQAQDVIVRQLTQMAQEAGRPLSQP